MLEFKILNNTVVKPMQVLVNHNLKDCNMTVFQDLPN